MKSFQRGAVLGLLATMILAVCSCVATKPNAYNAGATKCLAENEAAKRYDERMAWWREARFGMFIHWGLYSEAAGVWNGKSTHGLGEWIMNDMKIPAAQYAGLAARFDPIKFNADQWVSIAKQAGMKYIVITSKHHDGFCMFNTRATSFNIVDDTPWHRDPLKALSKACRRQGIKFCVYYSIMDWHSPDQEPAKADPVSPSYDPTSFAPGKKQAYVQYMRIELKELITQYHPAVIWFDGEWMKGWTAQDGRQLYDYLRSLDPNLIINNRIGNRDKGPGDFGTPEQTIPPNGLAGQDWETCMTINDTWGYKDDDQNWKSAQTLIRNLIDCASKGGNYLLNVGPTGKGVIPPASVERLAQIGQWMKVNGQAIYGTSASPFATQLPWGRCTCKVSGGETTLYLHVFDWPNNRKLLVPGLTNQVEAAWLLANGKQLEAHSSDRGMLVSVPEVMPDKISSTIILKLKGAPMIAGLTDQKL